MPGSAAGGGAWPPLEPASLCVSRALVFRALRSRVFPGFRIDPPENRLYEYRPMRRRENRIPPDRQGGYKTRPMRLPAFALAGAAFAASAVSANTLPQDPGGSTAEARDAPAADISENAPALRPALYLGVDLVSMYVSRGLIFSDRVSVQPWVEADVPLERPEAQAIDEVSWFAGNWNSIQPGSPVVGEAPTLRQERLRDWYEADLYSGFRIAFGGRWTASLRYNYYTSPSDSFSDMHELDARVHYDDSDLWREAAGFAANPSIRLAKTTRNRDGPNPWYLETGIRPGGRLAGLPWNISLHIPLLFGFGADGQYRTPDGEHHFGFFQTGVHAGIPLDILPESAGALNLSAGYDMIAVRDRQLNLRGDRTTAVARIGLDYSY